MPTVKFSKKGWGTNSWQASSSESKIGNVDKQVWTNDDIENPII